MIWNVEETTHSHLFICQFLNGNGLFSDFFGVWYCPLNMLRNVLAKRLQLKNYVLWKAAVKLETLPESGLFYQFKINYSLVSQNTDWSTIVQDKTIHIKFKDMSKIHKHLKVICTLQLLVQTLLTHGVIQAHSHWCLTEQNCPCNLLNFVLLVRGLCYWRRASWFLLSVRANMHHGWIQQGSLND